jgi:hypothetical protein
MMCERTACDSTRHRHRRKRFGGNLRRDLDTEMDILISIRIWVSCLDSCRTWQCSGLLYAKESVSRLRILIWSRGSMYEIPFADGDHITEELRQYVWNPYLDKAATLNLEHREYIISEAETPKNASYREIVPFSCTSYFY